ncbi:MAG: hypothetical protein GY936_09975 [Ignavibacteriae bacterium]|nr:hypothetical protein [Ignavibacteriota bacterium]
MKRNQNEQKIPLLLSLISGPGLIQNPHPKFPIGTSFQQNLGIGTVEGLSYLCPCLFPLRGKRWGQGKNAVLRGIKINMFKNHSTTKI